MEDRKYNEEISEYSADTAKKIINKFKENLKENEKYLEQANNIDSEISKKKIKLDVLLEIIDNYKDTEFNDLNKKFLIYYKGDPYITINLFIQALENRSMVILAQDEFMISTNEILYTIFNKTLDEFKISNLIKRCLYNKEKIYYIKSILNAELVGIGDTLMYQMLGEEGKFYPYYNIIMYCDNNILDPVKKAVCIYANENHYELEIIYKEDLEDIIKYMNMVETVDIIVLLSNSKNIISEFESKITKKLFINENPFTKSYGKIYEYLK